MRNLIHKELKPSAMTEAIPAPLALWTGRVQPEWIDYNRHMMDGYYAVAFSPVVDAFMDYIGLDAAYRARTGCTVYTAELHVVYLRELKEGAPLRFETQLIAYDAKRFHLFHWLTHSDENYLAATAEFMLLHVDQQPMRVVPMPGAVLQRLVQIAAAHATLPKPAQLGRRMGLK